MRGGGGGNGRVPRGKMGELEYLAELGEEGLDKEGVFSALPVQGREHGLPAISKFHLGFRPKGVRVPSLLPSSSLAGPRPGPSTARLGFPGPPLRGIPLFRLPTWEG